jgi:predicted permease
MSPLARLWNLWRRAARDRELDDELQFHLDMRVARNVGAGMSPDAAEAEARRHLGSRLRAREGMRAAGSLPRLESMLHDVAYAGRTLRRRPWFTAIAILTIGVGIGLNIAVFSVVDRVLVRQLPYYEPDRLAFVRLCRDGCGTSFPPALADALPSLPSIDGVGVAWFPGSFAVSPDPESVTLTLSGASSGLLPVLGVAPVAGRGFTDDDVSSGRRVVIITYESWHTTFGGAAGIIGTDLWARGQPFTIVGVLPPGFIPPLWVARVPVWNGFFVTGETVGPIVRLGAGATLERAREEVERAALSLAAAGAIREDDAALVQVDAARAALFEHEWRHFALLSGATAVLLLLACVNLSTLLLARSRTRDRDLAIAVALGAGRARLVRQALLEASLLCALGGGLAVAVLAATGSALTSLVPPLAARYATPVTDGRIVIAATGIAMICAIIAGLIPALRATRLDLLAVLQRATASARRRRSGVRTMLVTTEAALGAVLVVSALLMIQTFSRMAGEDVGYRPAGLYVVNAATATAAERSVSLFEALADVLREMPGIASVAVADSTGLGNIAPFMGFQTADGTTGSRFEVSASFFDTAGAPLMAGRTFTDTDVRQRAPLVVLSAAAVRMVWPGEAPADVIGRALTLEDQPSLRVIGVVPDFKRAPGPGAAAPPAIFLPYGFHGVPVGEILVRTAGGTAPPLPMMQARVRERLVGVTSMWMSAADERHLFALADPRFRAVLFGTLAFVGLLLAATGLYAVAAFDVRQREYEIGVRIAHGATGGTVRRMMIRQGLPPVLLGLALGLIAAFWTGALLQQFLYEVEPRDLRVFAAVAAIMIVTALLAVWLPARRASRLDPAVVLRAE